MTPDTNAPARGDPTFPRPISVGARSVGWIEAEGDDWLARRVEKSRQAQS